MMRRLPEKLAARSRVRLLTISDDPQPRVNYGRTRLPAPGHPIGGEIKLIHLRKAFPEALDEFNLIYLVSSALPPHAEELVDVAKRRGAKLVWNQNGVAYPGFYGDSYPWFNRRLAALRSRADYIVNQSEFSRISAERYLGASEVPSEVLFNPVDTSLFAPAPAPLPPGPWRILAAGTSHALYRTKSALETLRVLLSRGHDVRLAIAGEFRWSGAGSQVRDALRGLEEKVSILPPFRQAEAPAIYRNAHLLLHTKYNDPCPTVPIEAMACGLPVVGTRSGGMGELVSEACGVLVPVAQGWTRDVSGNPELLADAVERVMTARDIMAGEARARAEKVFDVHPWIARHAMILKESLCR